MLARFVKSFFCRPIVHYTRAIIVLLLCCSFVLPSAVGSVASEQVSSVSEYGCPGPQPQEQHVHGAGHCCCHQIFPAIEGWMLELCCLEESSFGFEVRNIQLFRLPRRLEKPPRI